MNATSSGLDLALRNVPALVSALIEDGAQAPYLARRLAYVEGDRQQLHEEREALQAEVDRLMRLIEDQNDLLARRPHEDRSRHPGFPPIATDERGRIVPMAPDEREARGDALRRALKPTRTHGPAPAEESA